jgi:small basic protein (TIGR04137 family)
MNRAFALGCDQLAFSRGRLACALNFQQGFLMSIHGTYISKGGFVKHRNVLSRAERIERLKVDGKWSDKDAKGVTSSIFNLP